MLLQKEREQVVEYGKKMSSSGLSKGTSGNISVFNSDEKLMAISPSGVGYFETTPEDVVVMDLEGNIVDGDKKPSSEHGLHSIFYRTRPGINAVVHTHSTYCTTLACLNEPIKAVHYVIGVAGTATVPCAPYATYGTPGLAENAEKVCGEGKAVLLANHGLLTIGPSLAKAFSIAGNMEFIAEMQYRTRAIGTPVILDDDEMNRVMEKFKTHGQVKKPGQGESKVY